MKSYFRYIVLALVVLTANALSVPSKVDNETTDVESRKHHFFAPAILGFGGLQALALLYLIKVKVVVVAVIVGFFALYWGKLFVAKNCGTTVIRESAPATIYEGYSNHISSGFADHPPADYNGPDPYSEYSHIHPDIASDDHLSTGYGSDIHHDHTAIDASSPYRRVSTSQQQRQFPQSDFEKINWGEIMFRFLGVDSDGCRRRFVCEFDFKTRRNPFTSMIVSMMSHPFLDPYRDLSADAVKPKKFADCAKMYKECSAAAAYTNENVTEQ